MIRKIIIACALAFASPAVAQPGWSDSSGREGRGHGPRAEDVRPDRQGGGRRDNGGWHDDRRRGGYYQGGRLRIEGGIRLDGSVGVVVRPRRPPPQWSPCYTVQVTDRWGRPAFDHRGRPLLEQRCW